MNILYSASLVSIFLFMFNFLFGQVAQIPQVYYNNNTTNLNIRISAGGSATPITTLSQTSKIGVDDITTSIENFGTATWARVCLPTTTSGIKYGYMMYGEYYIRIDEINNYATVTATNLNIRTSAGSSSWVTINGQNTVYGQNSIVALTGTTAIVSGTTWYEVYLTNDCSQSTGWLSGAFLSLNNNTTNYYNVAGTVTNNFPVIWGANVNIGSFTTNSTEGFYQYKLSPGWSGSITCSHPNYNTSTPVSYSHTANGHNYSRNFNLTNSSCTAPTTQASNLSFTGVSNNQMTLSWATGNGTNRIVIAKANSAITGSPSNSSTYTASATFGSGTQLGTGEFVVYNGTGTSVTVSNLSPTTTYHFRVFEYSCSPAQYLISPDVNNPASQATTSSCTAPTTQASNLSFTGVSNNQMTLSWAIGDGTNRIVIAKANSAITGSPSNSSTYTASATFGSGTQLGTGEFVVYNGTGTSVTVSNLSPTTTYHFRVFEYSCSPTQYLTSPGANNPASQATTTSCSSPTTPASNITFSSISNNQMTLSWAIGDGTNRIVVAKANSAITGNPSNGSTYSASATFGSGTQLGIGSGEFVVYNGTGTSVTVSNLSPTTTYHFRVFEYSCSPTQYLTSPSANNPASQATTTSCSAPTTPASNITFSSISNSQMTLSWANGNGTNRIVIAKANSAITGSPNNGTNYTANATFGTGTQLGTGEFVVYNGTGTSVTVSNLSPNITYHFRVFEFSCSPIQYLSATGIGNPRSQSTNGNASINITSFDIPAWQRENDNLEGKININYTNIPIGQTIKLELYANGQYRGNPMSFNTTSASGTYTFTFNIAPSTLLQIPKDGEKLGYQIFYSATVFKDVDSLTNIIESDWNNKNIVYYNFVTEKFKIPIKYVKGTTSIKLTISKDNLTSNKLDNILIGNALMNTLIQNYKPYFTLDYLNSNLEKVTPGEFIFTLDYIGTSYSESGRFDLVKIGKIKTSNGNNKILILVGGLINEMELSAADLRNAPVSTNWGNSSLSFSIGPYLNNSGYDIWYIAQGNTNSIIKNGYNLGIGLQEIKRINTSCTEINFIGHSKGGLEIRALMAQPQSFTLSLNNNSFDFNKFQTDNSNIVKKVLFIGTPHRGAVAANLFYLIAYIEKNLPNTPAYVDLMVDNSNIVLKQINQKSMPTNIEFANLTGYINFLTLNDFIVVKDESEFPYLGNSRSAIQLYQNDSRSIFHPSIIQPWFHMRLHQTFYIKNNTKSDCTNDISNLEKIRLFFSPNGYNQSCNFKFTGGYTFYASGSILSNCRINVKFLNDSLFQYMGTTNELGILSLNLNEELQIGDSLQFVASGKETLTIPVDTQMVNTKNIIVPMLNSLIATSDVKYASFKLVNQTPITDKPTIDIDITAENALSYEINHPFNQDSIFIPINSDISTLNLDTGLNQVIIRFIGQNMDVISKNIYYLPDTLLTYYTNNINVSLDSTSIGCNLFVNNEFYKNLDSAENNIRTLKGDLNLKFIKLGYKPTTIKLDSTLSIHVNLSSINYSSTTDSNTINFPSQGKIQYRKNITVMDSAIQSIISVKQYDDKFSGSGFIPKSRKFEMKLLNSKWSNIRFAAVLDQIENFSTDSVFLMRIYDDTAFTKMPFDTLNVAGYDSMVQKLTYNYINFNNGKASKEALVIMKKQAPIAHSVSAFNMNQNDTLILPLAIFFKDPDSITDDMIIQRGNSTPQLNVQIVGDSVVIIPTRNWNGIGSLVLSAQHDNLWRNTSVEVNVIPDQVRNHTGFIVYPNPTNDVLNISGSKIENGEYYFELISTSGKILFSDKMNITNNSMKKQFSLEELSSGIYFLVIEHNKIRTITKVQKAH